MTTRKTKQRAANAALTIFLLTVSIIVLSPLLLALLMLGAFLAGCTGSSTDRCVKVEGDTISIPSMRVSFSFPAPWFVVTDEELEELYEMLK